MSSRKELAISVALLLASALVYFAMQQTAVTEDSKKSEPLHIAVRASNSEELEVEEAFVVVEISAEKPTAAEFEVEEPFAVAEIEINEHEHLAVKEIAAIPKAKKPRLVGLQVEEGFVVAEIETAEKPELARVEMKEGFVVAEIEATETPELTRVEMKEGLVVAEIEATETPELAGMEMEEGLVVAEIEAAEKAEKLGLAGAEMKEEFVVAEIEATEKPELAGLEMEEGLVVAEIEATEKAEKPELAGAEMEEGLVVAEIEATEKAEKPELAGLEMEEGLVVAEIEATEKAEKLGLAGLEMEEGLVVAEIEATEKAEKPELAGLEMEEGLVVAEIKAAEKPELAGLEMEEGLVVAEIEAAEKAEKLELAGAEVEEGLVVAEIEAAEKPELEMEEGFVVAESAFEGAVLALEEALVPNETATLQELAAAVDRGLAATREETSQGLRGIVLNPDRDAMLDPDSLEGVEGIFLNGVTLPGDYANLLCRLERIYEGKPIQFELIQEIKREISLFYEQNHVPFVLVAIPQQKICHHVLQLVVMRSMLGQIVFEGNNWFSDGMLQRYVKAAPEKEIDVVALQRDLNAMNRNPFRRCNLMYEPGECFGTTNLIVSTEDRLPLRVYVGTDNTGVESTGRERAISGISVGRLFGLDHVASYQYTASYDFSSFQGHTLQYIAPLPWKNHFLNLYGGFSTVKPTLPTPTFRSTGENKQLSARYVMPLFSPVLHQQEISLGFDYKLTNNTVLFSDLIDNFSSKVVNLSQLVGEYKKNHEWKHNRIDVDLKLVWSPGDILANESNERYEQLRDHAKNRWIYALGSFRYLYRNSHRFEYSVWIRGQISSASLLPSEQLGIGGYDTVRGYDERQLNMDNGVLGNLELRSPVMPLFQTFYPRKIKDGLQLLVFADGGWGVNNTQYDGEPTNDYLVGAGPGVRYTLEPYITLRADWGLKLHHQALDTGDKLGELHFSFTAGY